MEINANEVAQRLAQRVAQLELEVTVLQLALEKYQQDDTGTDEEESG